MKTKQPTISEVAAKNRRIPHHWRKMRHGETCTRNDIVWVGCWEPCKGFIGFPVRKGEHHRLARRISNRRKKK